MMINSKYQWWKRL